MAKCIRVVGQGVPVRMSDEDAFQVVVRDHDGEYCPKQYYKSWHEPAVEGKEPTTKIVKLQQGKLVETGTLARNLQHKREKKRHAV
jgi:hypothetical protein